MPEIPEQLESSTALELPNVQLRDVTKQETVAGQMEGLLSKESPLTTMARTKTAEEANKRGLLNTSLAVQAGEAAAIQSALPIAQQDAKTYAESALTAQKGQISGELTQQEFAQKESLVKTQASQDILKAKEQKDIDIAVDTNKANWDFKIRDMMEKNSFNIAEMQDLGSTARTTLETANRVAIANIDASVEEKKAAMSIANDLGQQFQDTLSDIATAHLSAAAKSSALENAYGAYRAMLNTGVKLAGLNIEWVKPDVRRMY